MQGGSVVAVALNPVSASFQRAFRAVLPGVPSCEPDELGKVFSAAGKVLLLSSCASSVLAFVRSFSVDEAQRVVVVCEQAEVTHVVQLFRCKIADCIVGEASLAELRALVSSCEQDSLLVLDERDLAVEAAGRRRQLTKKQFKLLVYLAQRPGEWVSTAELVSAALDTHHLSDSSIVRVHVCALRRTLGHLAHLIETDRSRARGYRFRGVLARRDERSGGDLI